MTRQLNSFMALSAMILLASAQPAWADSLRDTMFKDADQARQAAIEAEAALLAPRSFERATKAYQNAEKKLDRGLRLDRIKGDLDAAVEEFTKSVESAKLARVSLGNMIKSRKDAESAQGATLANDTWRRAEREFRSAAIELEVGNLRTARKRAASAEEEYRDAELQAIKTSMLSETKRLLEEADDKRAGRYAPKTLDKATALLARAERELEENRYDADLPRSLARDAKYEARHAIYLAAYLRDARDRDLTEEDLVLAWEQPIHQIAAAADMVAALDQGFDGPAKELSNYIEDVRKKNQSLEQDLLQRDQRILALEQEISELDERLGGAREERMALAQKLAAQERIREQVKQVEGIFSRDEALVFRDGNDIFLRFSGLNFEVGRSSISAANYALLDKVERAIRVFPDASIVVEGHTDSHGSDDANMRLSQDRAEAVRQHLLQTMHLDPAIMTAVGYGETQPVANNETPEGRRKNRRIDIRIRPSMDIH